MEAQIGCCAALCSKNASGTAPRCLMKIILLIFTTDMRLQVCAVKGNEKYKNRNIANIDHVSFSLNTP